ncbi:hypothetical protein V2W45_1312646 [Cenococcum geophilum]
MIDGLGLSGEQAARDGLQHFWVDTCCINKSSDSELSEAINSMFRWYRNATKCYAYLPDISTNDYDDIDLSSQPWEADFREALIGAFLPPSPSTRAILALRSL